VKKLRDAGAIILAKVNLSEFAGARWQRRRRDRSGVLKAGAVPNGFSSMGGQTHNPHESSPRPAGPAVERARPSPLLRAVSASAPTPAGSVRGPSSANGLVGLKPTHGLLSRDGIVPLALTFDTGGPIARSVYDIAVCLGVMTGRRLGGCRDEKKRGQVRDRLHEVSQGRFAQRCAHRRRP